MNISQHCFVPRGKVLDGKYYTLAGSLNSSVGTSTTEKQIGDTYNCFQLFGSYILTGSYWYALRLFNSPSGQHSDNFVGVTDNTTGYVSPALEKKSDVYTSSAFTLTRSSYSLPGGFYPYSNGYPVVCVMWCEENPTVSSLSLRNTLRPDVIDNEEEII